MTGKTVRVAVVQCGAASEHRMVNVLAAKTLAEEAADDGAKIILLPELFDAAYFPQTKDPGTRLTATPVREHPTVGFFTKFCAEYGVVMPVSFYELAPDGRRFNSVAIIDSDRGVLGVYRKSHIPGGVRPENQGYYENFYFEPGDTGFRVWATSLGVRVGVGICADQWRWRCSQAMMRQGAELLLYPSTIGSEPGAPGLDTRDKWRRAQQGQASALTVPWAAANRVGTEGDMRFYGSSFICDGDGAIVTELDRDEQGVAWADIDLAPINGERELWEDAIPERPDLCQH